MTRIAASTLLLTMGVFSAIAVTGQTGVLARPVPSLDVTAQSGDEINDKNWQKHPTIIAIRRIVNSANAAVRSGAFKTEHRICEEGWFSRLRIARDSRGPSDGTSIIRRVKTRPGTIISTTTMRVVCGLC